jgi:hypothetical protein
MNKKAGLAEQDRLLRVDKRDTLRMKTASLGLPPRFLALIALHFVPLGRRERSLCSLLRSFLAAHVRQKTI